MLGVIPKEGLGKRNSGESTADPKEEEGVLRVKILLGSCSGIKG